MRGDNSPRTRMIGRYNVVFVICFLAIVASAVWWVLGMHSYSVMLDRSSSPKGTQLVFQKSMAAMTMTNIYTDTDRTCMAIRFSMDDSSRLNLPWRGEDFDVFIAAKYLDGYVGQLFPIEFGFYSPTGDLFLFVPKPKSDTIYSIYIVNDTFYATDSLSNASGMGVTTTIDIDGTLSTADAQTVIRDQLSQGDYSGVSFTSSSGSYSMSNSILDIAAFKVTLDPAIESSSFSPVVLPTTILVKNADGTTAVDHDAFFSAIFKDSIEQDASVERARLLDAREPLLDRIDNLNVRLADNPDDAAAKATIDALQERIDQIDSRVRELAQTYQVLQSITFEDSLYTDLEVFATIISSDDALLADAII